MKIAIDGYELGREARGVGRVIDNILLPLVDFLPGDEFLVYTKEGIGKFAHPRVSEQVLGSPGGYLRWQNGPLRRALKEANPDVFIATNYTLPLFSPRDSVLFEYDLSVISHPEWYSRKYALPRRYLIKRSLRKAALVVTSSEFIKKEILNFFNSEPEKIRVIGFGVEDKFRRVPRDSILAWIEEKGLKGKKIVGYLGSFFKRRHIPSLVQAVEILRREFPETVLYVVGKDLSGLRPGKMAKVLSREWVRWEETLPEAELPFFYSALDAFAYLSEYEGFGFPPLEALACGTPVVLMKGSSLEEVFGDVAIMVGKPEEGEVGEALRTALMDDKRRVQLLNRFEQKRAQFSWQRTARELSFLLRGIKST